MLSVVHELVSHRPVIHWMTGPAIHQLRQGLTPTSTFLWATFGPLFLPSPLDSPLYLASKKSPNPEQCICEADRTSSHRYVWETCRCLFRAGDCVCVPLCVQRQQQAASCVEVTSRWTRRAECSADSGGSKWLCGRWSLCQGRKMAAQEHQRAPLLCTSPPASRTHTHSHTRAPLSVSLYLF